ncbi:MAG: hypothetical protein Q8Q02_15670 [Nocardioides sp.]|nr:hypothetical protein [Nocardioides sp.]
MSTRVFVPVTAGDLRVLAAEGALPAGTWSAHTVTDALRASWPDGDDEEWSYAALLTAAQESVERMADHPEEAGAPRRRVLAAEVAEVVASPDPDAAETGVGVSGPLPLSSVDALHVDEEDAEPVVGAAVRVLTDDRDAEDAETVAAALEACLEHDLGWYATQELDQLL